MRLPFTRKDKAPKAPKPPKQVKSRNKRPTAERSNRRTYSESDNTLPGISGYLYGLDGEHPHRFRYERPDGCSEGAAPSVADEDLPAVKPSRRPVPRGFFGP